MLALAILIVGAASVCASDVNDTATADAGQIELSAADESAIPAQGNDESSAPGATLHSNISTINIIRQVPL